MTSPGAGIPVLPVTAATNDAIALTILLLVTMWMQRELGASGKHESVEVACKVNELWWADLKLCEQ